MAISKTLRASPLKIVAVAGNSPNSTAIKLSDVPLHANVVISLGASLRNAIAIFIAHDDMSDIQTLSKNLAAESTKNRSLMFQLVDANSGEPHVFDLPWILNQIHSREAKFHCLCEILSASDRHQSTRMFGLISFNWLGGGLSLDRTSKIIELAFSPGGIDPPLEVSAYLVRLHHSSLGRAETRIQPLQITTEALLTDSITHFTETILRVFGNTMAFIKIG